MTITNKQKEDNTPINKKQMQLWAKEIENRDQQNAIMDGAEKRESNKSCAIQVIAMIVGLTLIVLWRSQST